MYNGAKTNQLNLKEAPEAAMDWLWEAMEDVCNVQSQLVDADFQLGRVQYLIKKSGYGDILGCPGKRLAQKLQAVQIDSEFAFLLYTNALLIDFPDSHCVTIPGGGSFAVRLD